MLESNPGLLRLWQSDALSNLLDLIHSRLDLVHTPLDLIHTRLDLIHYYKMTQAPVYSSECLSWMEHMLFLSYLPFVSPINQIIQDHI
jgi:hypothetical protein